MIFTGRNLQRVRQGIEYALDEIHNRIGTCPDVELYEAYIDELEQEQEEYKRLLARIDRAIEKERQR